MPRNASSVYSLPAGNPVIPGTVIATTWANTTLTDIATALTNSLSTDGSTASVSLAGKTMTGGIFNGPSVTGALTLTGGQIAFPVVQVPSAGANVLDDYEEGTWTPTLTFATVGNLAATYTNRLGTYTKIGRQVTMAFNMAISAFTHTTAAGNALITGFPFGEQSGMLKTGKLDYQGILKAGYTEVASLIPSASSTAQLIMCAAQGGVVRVNVTTVELPSGGTPTVNGTIIVDAS